MTRLAEEGDEAAVSVLEETGRWLGVGLAGFVNIFNPEMVAVGGGAAAAGEFILGARQEGDTTQGPLSFRDLVEVRLASLGPESGILGAAALARNPDTGEYVLEA